MATSTQYVIKYTASSPTPPSAYFPSGDTINSDCWTGWPGDVHIIKFTNSDTGKIQITSVTLWLGTGTGYFYVSPPAATGYGWGFETKLIAGGTYDSVNRVVTGGVVSNPVWIDNPVGVAYGQSDLYDTNWKKVTFNFSNLTVNANSAMDIYIRVPETRILCIDTKYRQSTLSTFPGTVTVTYNANGGSGAPSAQSGDTGSKFTISSTTPTLSGYNFVGWAITPTPSATTTLIQPGEQLKITDNVTFYAAWKYTLSYNKNTEDAVRYFPSNMNVFRGKSAAISNLTPLREGYTFTEWNTSADGSGVSYPVAGTYEDHGNVTLYAQWKQNTPVYIRKHNQWEPVNIDGVLRYDASTTTWVSDLPVWKSSDGDWSVVE